MSQADHTQGWRQRGERLMNRRAAQKAVRASRPHGLALFPEPRCIGMPERGRQLLAGNFLFAGTLVEAQDTTIWDLPGRQDGDFLAELHGFRWLDDLVALGSDDARERAKTWTAEWLGQFGDGVGPGWEPELAGRRAIRLVSHAPFLLLGATARERSDLLTELSAHALFLSRRWTHAAHGRPRVEALAGLIHLAVSVKGQQSHVGSAFRGLVEECNIAIDTDGGVPSRNPEDLLDTTALLVWSAQAGIDAGHVPDPALEAAITRAVPVLRTLRHSDGALARFHGGGRGTEGRAEQLLAATGLRPEPNPGMAMGFARLSGARTSVIVDAAVPPASSEHAHSSTLGFELTSGRRPLIVNCGPGASFGETWWRLARSPRSHSTLSIEEGSRLAALSSGQDGAQIGRPRQVLVQQTTHPQARGVLLSHDGFVARHGLTHSRQLTLSRDGRELAGEDTVGAVSEAHRAVLMERLSERQKPGLPMAIRFHLHPDVVPDLDEDTGTVTLKQPSGEEWVFSAEGGVRPVLEASVYLEVGRLKPTATKQIVLSGQVGQMALQINWTLSKAQGTPLAIRDLQRLEGQSQPIE